MNNPQNPKPKNIVGKKLLALRTAHNLSQRALAIKLQLMGYDVDKNVICRIETGKRHVTDKELKAFSKIFQIPIDCLLCLDKDSSPNSSE